MNSIFSGRGLRGTLLATLLLSVSAAQAAEKSLYDRLGGLDALNAVVGHLWTVVAADARINNYFANTKPEVFAGALVNFLCVGAGGPCQYTGKDMHAAHQGMNLTAADFDALADDIVVTLDHFKVPSQEKGEVMAMLGGMKGQVINH